jgi:hypothetical protein
MTEAEVKEIIKKFNETINKHTLEKTELEKRI